MLFWKIFATGKWEAYFSRLTIETKEKEANVRRSLTHTRPLVQTNANMQASAHSWRLEGVCCVTTGWNGYQHPPDLSNRRGATGNRANEKCKWELCVCGGLHRESDHMISGFQYILFVTCAWKRNLFFPQKGEVDTFTQSHWAVTL